MESDSSDDSPNGVGLDKKAQASALNSARGLGFSVLSFCLQIIPLIFAPAFYYLSPGSKSFSPSGFVYLFIQNKELLYMFIGMSAASIVLYEKGKLFRILFLVIGLFVYAKVWSYDLEICQMPSEDNNHQMRDAMIILSILLFIIIEATLLAYRRKLNWFNWLKRRR